MSAHHSGGLPSTIAGINLLPEERRREIYINLVPAEIFAHFNLRSDLYDSLGRDLVRMKCEPGQSDAEVFIYHQADFRDPVLYGHLTDTVSGQIYILLYVINDPESRRFDIDRLPDGSPTLLGAVTRNLEQECLAFEAGLAPGQVRHGLRLLLPATQKFEDFVHMLGHTIYFAEPLYYHNAILFERYGFAYQSGRKLMEEINAGFQPRGSLARLLDGSTPFRQRDAARSVRKRSWAIHDGILGAPFSGVKMYKRVGFAAGLNTAKNLAW